MMKKKAMILGSALMVMVATTAGAQESDFKRYVGVNAGASKMEFGSYSMGSDTSLGFYFGLLASNSHEVRFGYNQLGKFKGSDTSSVSADILFKHPVVEQGEVYGGLGLGTLKFETTQTYTTNYGQTYTSKDTANEFSYRASIGYRHHFGRFSVQGEGQYIGGLGKTAQDIKLTNFVVGANVAF